MNLGKISELISNATCFEMIRENRWPDGVVHCPHCGSEHIKKNGHDTVQTDCQHYQCKHCTRYFDDLTNTVFAGHHQPLKVWISCLYLMGLNVSNNQIAKELDLCTSDVHAMTTLLRTGVVERKPDVTLEGEVEFDEVYIVAGHKGHPEALKNLPRPPRKRRLKGAPGRGTLEKDKPPVLGMIQRGGQVVINMLDNVRKATIKPFITGHVAKRTQTYTDEYSIYNSLEAWGFKHKSVCHGDGEYARDDDKDGIYEVHVNTMEGFWSLLRSWLRPHRGISQESLPLYLGFFEFVHNAGLRGKGLLQPLINLLIA